MTNKFRRLTAIASLLAAVSLLSTNCGNNHEATIDAMVTEANASPFISQIVNRPGSIIRDIKILRRGNDIVYRLQLIPGLSVNNIDTGAIFPLFCEGLSDEASSFTSDEISAIKHLNSDFIFEIFDEEGNSSSERRNSSLIFNF